MRGDPTRVFTNSPATTDVPHPHIHWTPEMNVPYYVESITSMDKLPLMSDGFDTLMDTQDRPFVDRNEYKQHFSLAFSHNMRRYRDEINVKDYERQVKLWNQVEFVDFDTVMDTVDQKGNVHLLLMERIADPGTTLSHEQLLEYKELTEYIFNHGSKTIRIGASTKDWLYTNNYVCYNLKVMPPKAKIRVRIDLTVQCKKPYLRWFVTNVALKREGTSEWQWQFTKESDVFPTRIFHEDPDMRRSEDETLTLNVGYGLYEEARHLRTWTIDPQEPGYQADMDLNNALAKPIRANKN
jgi:hypothetical protein